jgi:hypothetical protein
MRIVRIVLLLLIAGLVAAWARVYFRSPGVAPLGQRDVLALNAANFSEFEAAFDTYTDRPRLVLLFSPT